MSADPFPNPLPPLTDETEADLAASIAERGVIYPAVYDQHGRTLDGNHRERLAGERGVDMPPPLVVEVRDDEHAREVALELNIARRHLSVPARQALVAGLRAEGKSTRAIAADLGVDPKTVRNDLKASGGDNSPPASVVGQDGKTYPAKRQLKDPATDKQLHLLASLCRRDGDDMPRLPISKRLASKLIDERMAGPTRLDAGPWIERLRKLVEEAEAAYPLGSRVRVGVAVGSAVGAGHGRWIHERQAPRRASRRPQRRRSAGPHGSRGAAMSALTAAILADLTDDDLAALAARLAPFLEPAQPAPVDGC
jgi:hypothetical protein